MLLLNKKPKPNNTQAPNHNNKKQIKQNEQNPNQNNQSKLPVSRNANISALQV